MGIDKTQSALEILKYFYQNDKRDSYITISEIRKKLLSRPKSFEEKVWMKSKMGAVVVRDIIDIFLDLGYIKKGKPIKMKDKEYNTYKITEKGKKVVEDLKSSNNLNELFSTILYRQIMKPR